MNQPAQVRNPFPQLEKSSSQQTSLVEVEGQRAIQEVQAAMVIAKKFPREQIEAMDRIIQACTRTSLAEGALYSYPRGGQNVTGPSIRLAEAVAQAWGNLQFGIRELSQANGESTVEAYAWDVETNTRQVKVFQVPHVRFTRNGGAKKLQDPRDIYEVVANQGARRLRACILGIIPGDVIEAAQKQCEETLHASASNDPESIKKMIEAFKQFKITDEMIKKRLGCRVEAILPAQMVQLKKIYASLRDGMSTATDWFEVTVGSGSASESTKALEKSIQSETRAPEPKAEPAVEPDFDHVTFYKQSIDSCATVAELQECAKDIGENVGSMNDAQVLEVKSYLDLVLKAAKSQDNVPEDFKL